MEKNQYPQAGDLLENPDILLFYDLCLSNDFQDDIAYQQGLLAFVHACDLANGDENAQHNPETVVKVGLALMDIHHKTQHYEYYFSEMDFLSRNYSEHDNIGEKIKASFVKVHEEIDGAFPEIRECPVSAKILTN